MFLFLWRDRDVSTEGNMPRLESNVWSAHLVAYIIVEANKDLLVFFLVYCN